METNFNFKSQICTDKNQSERLLALGLKKETADMAYRTTGKVVDMGEVRWMYQHNPSVVYKGMMCKEDIPAWSLHRLLVMYGDNYSFFSLDNAYGELIHAIAIDIENGDFNKCYLEEKQ